jgi:hypothetical protein
MGHPRQGMLRAPTTVRLRLWAGPGRVWTSSNYIHIVVKKIHPRLHSNSDDTRERHAKSRSRRLSKLCLCTILILFPTLTSHSIKFISDSSLLIILISSFDSEREKKGIYSQPQNFFRIGLPVLKHNTSHWVSSRRHRAVSVVRADSVHVPCQITACLAFCKLAAAACESSEGICRSAGF